MHNLIPLIKFSIRTAFLLLAVHSTAHATSLVDLPAHKTPIMNTPIVVTIKPLYSLVAHLTEGVETPVLLMQQTQSAHHFTMKPSQRRLLANAKMIIWLGPQLENTLSNIIQQQSTLTITTSQAKDLKLLNLRHKLSHQHTQAESNLSRMIDPHIWLSTENAAAISRQIARFLIEYDAENTVTYQHNLNALLKKIEQTRYYIEQTLENKQQPFIVFHDAFQYFEVENNLNYVDSISFSDENNSSLSHIQKIKNTIKKDNIRCLLYQQPKPAVINALIKQTGIQAIALDPLGLKTNNDKEAWFAIMRQLALNFEHCLKL